MVAINLRIRFWRLVRIMRIVQMNPHEVPPPGVPIEPALCPLHHIHAAPFQPPESRVRAWPPGEIVVVIEPMIEAGSQRVAVQYRRPDECCRVVSRLAQQRCQCDVACVEWNHKICYTMV